jgi:eukaryotic-like serine/threonine-protein kinase
MELLADRYELGDALGHGRSTVYRATDTRLRRRVAIKRVELLSGQEDAEAVRARALREAQASARLNNPATVAVYDVVEESGAIWLVMELVDGPSLAQVIADEGPLPHDRAARLGLQVLTALEAAHLAGVVHRDVKPANVLVLHDDRAKLTDFGVASIRDESRVTMTGLVVGSPSFMAPEQATAGDITAATDLWALGALLYFAVEGEPPFQASTALATATAVVNDPPRAQEHEGPLTPIIARLLTKDPAVRPSAGAVRATLTRVGRARPSSAMSAAASPVAAPMAAATASSESTAVLPDQAGQPGPPRPPHLATAPASNREPARPRTGPAPRIPVRAVAVVAALAVVVVLLAVRGGGGGGDGESAGRDPSTTTTTASTASTTPLPPATVPAGTLPAGWWPYADPAGGYTIGQPPGWEVQPVAANRTDFRDPATGTFVRVEWTDTPGPDAAGAWREAEPGFRTRNANYEPLGIAQVAYRDYPAALWEFRHGAGETLHTGNLGFIAAGRGYALMLRAPESKWVAAQPTFEQFKQAFLPA